MSYVGIIANPASGKDIRRLVSHASVYTNEEKINIIQRILLGLDALGVEQADIMPDYYGLGKQALARIRLANTAAGILEMPVSGTARDSMIASALFLEKGADCLIVLGGDGTHRVVTKGCGSIPIVPVSTGTNNAFPVMVEGTIAGLACGLVAQKLVDPVSTIIQNPRLEVFINHQLADIALVDVVTSKDDWIGCKAIWDPDKLLDIVVARIRPGHIGLSAIGGCLQNVEPDGACGLHVEIGPGNIKLLAPIGPGLIRSVEVRDFHRVQPGKEVILSPAKSIALDGEREIELSPGAEVSVRLSEHGPWVVDLDRCFIEASANGVFQRFSDLISTSR